MKWDPDNDEWVLENPGHGGPDEMPLTGEPDSFGYDADGDRLPYAQPGARPDHDPDFMDRLIERDLPEGQATDLELADGDTVSVTRTDAPGSSPDATTRTVTVEYAGPPPRTETFTWEAGGPVPSELREHLQAGHTYGDEYWRLKRDYLNGDLTQEQFLEAYNDLGNYELETASHNASHQGEKPLQPGEMDSRGRTTP